MSILQKDTKTNLIIGTAGALACGVAQSVGHPEISQAIEIGQDLYSFIQIAAAVATGVGSLATVYAAAGLAAKYVPMAIQYSKEKVHQFMSSKPITFVKDKFHQFVSSRPISYLKEGLHRLFGKDHTKENLAQVAYADQQNQAAIAQAPVENAPNQEQQTKNCQNTLVGRIVTKQALEHNNQHER